MNNKKFWISLLAGLMAGVMILTLLLQLIPTQAQAITSGEIQNQIDEMKKDQAALQEEINDLEAQRKDNLSELNDLVAQKNIVDQQIALIYEQIDSMNEQISAYAVMIADKQAELDKANEDLQEMKQKHMERLRAMEEDGSLSYWYVLFEANSFTDLLDRLNMIQEIAAADEKRIDEMGAAAKLVEETRLALQQEQDALQDSRQELAAKQVELDNKAKESEQLMTQLRAKGEEFDKWLDEREDDLTKLEDELADKKAEYDRVAFEEFLATSVPPTTSKPSSSSSSSSSGNGEYSETIWRAGKAMTPNTVNGVTWYTPCDYNRISSTFGMRMHPVYHYWKMHNGVDFAIGHTPIYATRPGVVTVATSWEDASAGYYVVIDHGDGYRSVYMHMCKRAYVKVGDFVKAGQELGCVGSTGASTGNHLHFGISKYNPSKGKYEYVNPLLYVK